MGDTFKETFKDEALELLAELEASLLALEKAPESRKTVGRVFRALHTIKGSGGMVGYDNIAAFAHEVENVFELVRLEQIEVSKKLVDLTLAAGDVIRGMLEPSQTNNPALESRAGDIVAGLKTLTLPQDEVIAAAPEKPSEAPRPTAGHVTYRISFRPHPNIFVQGINPLLLLNELRGLGPCNTTAYLDDIPALEDLEPEKCNTWWEVVLTTDKGIDAVKDVFIFVEGDCELSVEAVSELSGPADPESHKKLGEILVERGNLSREALQDVLGKQKRLGEMLVDAGMVCAAQVEFALTQQRHVEEIQEKQQKEEAASTLRVPAAKVDKLVDLVGELVTVQAGLSQLAASRKIPELRSLAEHVDRLTTELRENTMSIRMLPIGTTFNKFNRLVRDLSAELGKEVIMTTEGAETELDKTVIERLNDPLVHIIRNSIDHGIEEPGLRKANGKPSQGTVHLSAVHAGAHVLIRITDDGAGLDVEQIQGKAMEKGLITQGAALSEKEILDLVFAPGFSTAGKVTNVSGRGVGMDVVKRSIEALRGSIEVASEKGIGTTITLKLPLTLAIIDGLLVKIANAHFVVPLSIVEECVELTSKDVAEAHGRHLAHIRGEIVPYIRLRDRFQINGRVPPIEQIVVTESLGGKVGFVVDKVIGGHQTVIKTLNKIYRQVEGISGATILGDGTVALILDVPRLVRGVEMEEASIH